LFTKDTNDRKAVIADERYLQADKFYTMHCTDEQQFLKMKEIIGGQIGYLSCGDSIVI